MPLSHEETAGPHILPHAAPVGLPHIVCRQKTLFVKRGHVRRRIAPVEQAVMYDTSPLPEMRAAVVWDELKG
ncbi:MAG: hypothetical protein M3Z19_11755 [Chloroflexota bacterium]|nr:hypothetical protein [Chloroflexota bacterium]